MAGDEQKDLVLRGIPWNMTRMKTDKEKGTAYMEAMLPGDKGSGGRHMWMRVEPDMWRSGPDGASIVMRAEQPVSVSYVDAAGGTATSTRPPKQVMDNFYGRQKVPEAPVRYAIADPRMFRIVDGSFGARYAETYVPELSGGGSRTWVRTAPDAWVENPARPQVPCLVLGKADQVELVSKDAAGKATVSQVTAGEFVDKVDASLRDYMAVHDKDRAAPDAAPGVVLENVPEDRLTETGDGRGTVRMAMVPDKPDIDMRMWLEVPVGSISGMPSGDGKAVTLPAGQDVAVTSMRADGTLVHGTRAPEAVQAAWAAELESGTVGKASRPLPDAPSVSPDAEAGGPDVK